jgi:2-oxoglutarate dehydrogenase E2 component (dihydrolipoamide succinyltransferase)
VMPAAERLLAENKLRADQVTGTGPDGRILKEDVARHAETKVTPAAPPDHTAAPPPLPTTQAKPSATNTAGREEEVIPMTRLRRTVAARLVESQKTTASLTTFNEVDLHEVTELRKQFQESFTAKYGVKLGFMSFFLKAAVEALKAIPQVNAEIRGNDVVYHRYYDIGVAIGGGKGLVVPVLRNAERMSFSQIEIAIGEFAKRAKENKISMEELQGGTFTISNGGVYGSLLSTPILNPPQSGILGMHTIQERPVVRDGQIVIRPMMYLALTYDHRIVDGREAVTFLKRIKDTLESPARMLLEI